MNEELNPKDNSEKIILPLIVAWFILILQIISIKDYALEMEKSFVIFSIIRIVLYLINSLVLTRGFETKRFFYYLISLILTIGLNIAITIYFIYLKVKDSKIFGENDNIIFFIVMIVFEWALTIILLLYLSKAKKIFINKKKIQWSV